MKPCIQFISIQILGYKIFQIHHPIIPYFKFQDIVFMVQHGQMDVFLDAFFIRIIRQLLISAISRNDGILARNNRKINNATIIA